MIRTMSLTFSLLCALGGAALAAEPIEGNWKTESGETAAITNCGGAFCVTLKTGQYAGKQIGKLSGKGKEYTGEITDPEDNKTYEGAGSVNGNALKMKGCVLKIFCKSQTWTRL